MEKSRICYFPPLIRTGRSLGGSADDGRPSATSSPQTYPAMLKLWREVSWISAAAAALLIALFSSQNGATEQRAPAAPPVTVVAKTATAPAPYSVESDATRRVAGTVREFTDDLSRITIRLAAVEHSIDDLTATVMQQNQSSKELTGQTLPASAKDDSVTSTVAPASASGAAPSETQPPPPEAPPSAADAQADNVESASAYGAEIGTAVSMKMLIARWSELRSAHPGAFENLKPVATVKDNPRTNRVELRLVVGSVANRGGAAKLCASLAAVRIACQPVPLDGQQVALQ
jgi:hypothetical protein